MPYKCEVGLNFVKAVLWPMFQLCKTARFLTSSSYLWLFLVKGIHEIVKWAFKIFCIQL